MTALNRIVAAHPLNRKPYDAIRFVHTDGNGTPLYTVARNPKELGAGAALKAAFERFGGHCFHCGLWMPAQPLSLDYTRDHVRPRALGGQDYLHNLVFACGPCNRGKGGGNLISFRPEAGVEYLQALDAHIVRCLKSLNGQ